MKTVFLSLLVALLSFTSVASANQFHPPAGEAPELHIPGYFYDYKHGNYWAYKGPCNQYDASDYATCNNSKDRIKCDWNEHSKTCYPEAPKPITCKQIQRQNKCYKTPGCYWKHARGKCVRG